RDAGAEVRVVMTDSAREFVGPLTFQAVSGLPVHGALLDEDAEAGMGHIELARWADLVLVAPATASVIARLAAGMADDLLTTLCLATEAPIVIAPAMNRVMWSNPATGENVERLEQRGVRFVGPGIGDQACGETGAGRMVEPAEVVAAIAVKPTGRLAGQRVIVTAGPTLEPLDPVRFLGNRSSGKMGFAVAQALAEAGAQVTIVAGPVRLPTPPGIAVRQDVTSAREMHRAVLGRLDECHIFVAAAAVADFRPAEFQDQKIKKGDRSTLHLELVRNPDILAEVAAVSGGPATVGFAAETCDVEANARAKLERKGIDMIAANQVGNCDTGFDSEDNILTVIDRDGGMQTLDRAPKLTLARQLIDLIADRLAGKRRDD
ncbi:MAG: bifunctional phosphopantothenoylcysteine decarboxylase/phosphopantothenate--cysteine ligase CoaBC, partial [Pseudomonadota bacterium]